MEIKENGYYKINVTLDVKYGNSNQGTMEGATHKWLIRNEKNGTFYFEMNNAGKFKQAMSYHRVKD